MSHMQSLLDFCLREQGWLTETLERLVRLESPSTDKAAVDRCGAELERLLGSIGARVSRLPRERTGDHLRAEFGSGPRQVLLLAHFDTVWPVGQLETMPLREEDGRLYGPGIYDMKGGIAIVMQAIRALLAVAPVSLPHIVMLCTTDEEIGSATSKAVIEDEARRSEAVLVFEPSMPDSGEVKTARKGCAGYELRVRGVAAHSGEPHKGVSAVLELADHLLAIERLGDMGRDLTITAVMAGGGALANVVPEEAWALLDVRMPRLDDAAAVEAALRALQPRRAGARLTVSGAVERPPLERTPGGVRLFEMARAAGAGIGLQLREGTSGGVSDGNFTAALGVPTLDGLGAVGDGAHAPGEHVQLAALAPRAALVAGLLGRLHLSAVARQ